MREVEKEMYEEQIEMTSNILGQGGGVDVVFSGTYARAFARLISHFNLFVHIA